MLELFAEDLTGNVIKAKSMTDMPTESALRGYSGVHDGFVYMEHLEGLLSAYTTFDDDDWFKQPENLRKLRVRALTLDPNKLRKADTELDSTKYTTVVSHVRAGPAGQGDEETPADEEQQLTETPGELEELNAADENRGSILEAANELTDNEYHPGAIDNVMGKETESELKKKVKQQNPARAD